MLNEKCKLYAQLGFKLITPVKFRHKQACGLYDKGPTKNVKGTNRLKHCQGEKKCLHQDGGEMITQHLWFGTAVPLVFKQIRQ